MAWLMENFILTISKPTIAVIYAKGDSAAYKFLKAIRTVKS